MVRYAPLLLLLCAQPALAEDNAPASPPVAARAEVSATILRGEEIRMSASDQDTRTDARPPLPTLDRQYSRMNDHQSRIDFY